MKILKKILSELITIRKELQNIRVILESQFIPNYKSIMSAELKDISPCISLAM